MESRNTPKLTSASGLIYQNLEDTSELVVIDPQKQAGREALQSQPRRRANWSRA